MSDVRKPSHRLTFNDAVEVWKQYISGHYVQRIAASLDCNVGRIYEVFRGQLHPGSKLQAATELESIDKNLSAKLLAFIFKPKDAANDNQLDLFESNDR